MLAATQAVQAVVNTHSRCAALDGAVCIWGNGGKAWTRTVFSFHRFHRGFAGNGFEALDRLPRLAAPSALNA